MNSSYASWCERHTREKKTTPSPPDALETKPLQKREHDGKTSEIENLTTSSEKDVIEEALVEQAKCD